MFSEDDESGLFKTVKGLLYIFAIGALYYSGGYGWSLFFTRDENVRKKAGKYNLLALVIEIIIFVTIVMIISNGGKSTFPPDTGPFLVKFILIHFGISFVGSIFYLIWYLFS